jgi:hypothetical protein
MIPVSVEVQFPDDFEDQIMGLIQKRVDAALSVVTQVPDIVRFKAAVDNEDVDGKQMPLKKPRPPRNPKNHPNAPLVDTGNMMDKSRWTTERVDQFTAQAIYTPPAYFVYVGEQGRAWLTYNKMNESAREEIRQAMRDAARGAQ